MSHVPDQGVAPAAASVIGRLRLNALLVVLQTVVSIVAMMVTLRIVVGAVGLELFGLWSLILSICIAAKLADLSGGGGLAKFVAEDLAESKPANAIRTIHTVFISNLAFNAVAGIILAVVAYFVLPGLVDRALLGTARDLIPIAIISSVILAQLSGVAAGAVDGLQRADLRAAVVIASLLALLAASIILVPRFGLAGYGMALCIQHGIAMMGCWGVVARMLPGLGLVPYQWDVAIFKRTLAFSLKLQGVSIASMLSDPLAKFLLNHFAGLQAVGLFELIMRLVLAVRSVAVQAIQTTFPAFAALQSDRDAARRLLARTTDLAAVSCVLMTGICIAAAPFYYRFMSVGTMPPAWDMFLPLTLGYAINTIATGFHFASLANGVMRWNIVSQVVIAASIVVFGYPLGMMLGPAGVVVAFVAGLLGGAMTAAFGNAYAIGFRDLIPRTLLSGGLAAAVILVIALLSPVYFDLASSVMNRLLPPA